MLGNVESRDGLLVCGLSSMSVDLETGHCGSGDLMDVTHTHCPYCGADYTFCSHYVGSWSWDHGFSEFELPDVPDEWRVPDDWTSQELADALGDLQPAFGCYAECADGYSAARLVLPELFLLTRSVCRGVGWEGDGMAAGQGTFYYAAEPDALVTDTRGLIARLRLAIAQLAKYWAGRRPHA